MFGLLILGVVDVEELYRHGESQGCEDRRGAQEDLDAVQAGHEGDQDDMKFYWKLVICRIRLFWYFLRPSKWIFRAFLSLFAFAVFL